MCTQGHTVYSIIEIYQSLAELSQKKKQNSEQMIEGQSVMNVARTHDQYVWFRSLLNKFKA